MQMQTQEALISKIALVGVAIADVLTIMLNSGVFTLWTTIVGAVLFLVLLSYSQHGDAAQTRIEHVQSSAVFALSSLILVGWLVQPVYQMFNLNVFVIFIPIVHSYLAFTWAVCAFVLWLIATFVWMRVYPRQSWPGLFQTITHK